MSVSEKRILNAASPPGGKHGPPEGRDGGSAPIELSRKLQQTMLLMKGEFMSSDGKGVDYGSLGNSELFTQYVQLARQLDEADVSQLTEAERKAFFINVYNALTIHGLVVEGLPGSVLEVGRFWNRTAYLIGGQAYSLDDIEHGVLRGNRPHPSASDPPFSDSDPRRPFALQSCDPRIHFALVCGAKSCPAIQVYSAGNLDRALTQAARSFCAQEVSVDPGSRKVTLSKIFQWYGRDFGASEKEVLRWLCQYLPENEAQGLQELLSNQDKPVQIEAKDYNWLLNKL